MLSLSRVLSGSQGECARGALVPSASKMWIQIPIVWMAFFLVGIFFTNASCGIHFGAEGVPGLHLGNAPRKEVLHSPAVRQFQSDWLHALEFRSVALRSVTRRLKAKCKVLEEKGLGIERVGQRHLEALRVEGRKEAGQYAIALAKTEERRKSLEHHKESLGSEILDEYLAGFLGMWISGGAMVKRRHPLLLPMVVRMTSLMC